jgi:hypothetical protein
MRVRLPLSAPASHAVVAQRSELEAAKLETGVRLPLTAPFGVSFHGEWHGRARRSVKAIDLGSSPGLPTKPHPFFSRGHGPEAGRRASTPQARVRLPLSAPGFHAVIVQGQDPSMPRSGWGFDSPSPHHPHTYEPVLWEAARSAKPRVRVRFPVGSPEIPPSRPNGEAAVF